jgi:hypothetical protein
MPFTRVFHAHNRREASPSIRRTPTTCAGIQEGAMTTTDHTARDEAQIWQRI